MGGGFIEFIFGGGARPDPRAYRARPDYGPAYPQPAYARGEPAEYAQPARPAMDPRYARQVVDYDGREKAGTIVIDTPNKYLYLVQDGGRALRYGIGVGRPGFTWAGVKTVSAKKEWPDWTPPPEMLKRRPDLPHFMAGGPDNPLGARALYLGSSLYRIHGSNEPWTIGTAVSSGCIRMRNEDVIDLYGRVRVGTRVVVI
jgi:lipoprotein-anchoring transpeptidase ErfK/SrfK